MITADEARRIRDAARRMDEATSEWASAVQREANPRDIQACGEFWLSARTDFDDALLAVTDCSTVPAPVGKDG